MSVRLSHELPTRKVVRGLRPLLGPVLFATAPKFFGLQNVPAGKGPLLFVGNHTVFGLLDVWALFLTMLEEKDLVLRGLGDHVHFQVPVWGELMGVLGAVDGTRENCAALLAAGESVLVFPGGAREVAKRKGEKYKLVWKERIGFVRMAVASGATIIPFSAVGVEDQFEVVLDAGELFASPLGPLLRKLGIREDAVPPIARGSKRGLLPRPERLYFRIGAPIPTAHLRGQEDDDAVCRALRDRVRASVESGIVELQQVQATDEHRHVGARVRRTASKVAESLTTRARRVATTVARKTTIRG